MAENPSTKEAGTDEVKVSISKDESNSSDENPFARYYSQLLHQQNMLQDVVRTSTYQNAILQNRQDIQGKVVMDVGTGSGILAFFAAQAGARKVYAVEASDMADFAKLLVEKNGMSHIIEIVKGKVEEVDIPEKVDVIVSEPIGFLLVHERMLESYVAARKRFLKPEGLMLPTTGTIVFAPLSDQRVYDEQTQKATFWQTNNFYGVDLSCLAEHATREHLSQPIVGYLNPQSLLSSDTACHTIDFSTCTEGELTEFVVPFSFTIDRTALMHGFGCWFNASFDGSGARLTLCTGPSHPGTHWYQCRLLLKDPVAVNATQSVSGNMTFTINEKFSYYIDVEVYLDGTSIKSVNRIHLQDQVYHYLTSPESSIPQASPQTYTGYRDTDYGNTTG